MDEKLPVLKPKEAVKLLLSVGFIKQRQTGSHLILMKNRRIVVVPIHVKDLKRGVLKSIIKQTGLTVEEFCGLMKKKK